MKWGGTSFMGARGRQDADQLILEARQGGSEKLGALLELYRNYLYLLARTQIDLHLRARCNPSDLVQETFLQACRRFDQFRGCTEKEWLGWPRRNLPPRAAGLLGRHPPARKPDPH